MSPLKTAFSSAISLAVTVLGPASQQIGSLVIALATATVLSVQSYGVYALAIVFIEAGILLIYTGFHHYITSGKERADRLLPTMFTVMTGISTCFGVGLFLAAPTLASAFDTQTLAPVLMGLAVLQPGAAVIGWCSAVMLRENQAQTYFRCLLVSNVISVLIGVVCLIVFQSVFALVAYRVLRVALGLVLFLRCVPVMPSFGFDTAVALKAARFAKGLIGARALSYISNFGADILLAAMFSTAESGLFRLAVRMASAAVELVGLPIKTLAQMRFAKAARNGRGMQTEFNTLFLILLFYGGGVAMTVEIFSEPAIRQFFEPEYIVAAALAGPLAFRAVLVTISDLLDPVCAGLGNTDISLYFGVISAILALIALSIGAPFGLGTLVASLLIASAISTLIAIHFLFRFANINVRSLGKAVAYVLVLLGGYTGCLMGVLANGDYSLWVALTIGLGLALITNAFGWVLGVVPNPFVQDSKPDTTDPNTSIRAGQRPTT